ncbi:lactate racemase domain-containing protein [Chloroflexota bacterium]
MNKMIKVPQMVWHGVSELELPVPNNWQVEVCNMKGNGRKGLTLHEIRNAVRNTIGMEPIRSIARNRKQVVIIFDDIQRATRSAEIVPFILEELAEAGIPDSNIRFVSAVGCHPAMNRLDFVKKLGEDVLNRFPVYSHNAFGSCVDIGSTSFGTRLLVNGEVMSCDLKIAIGSVVPHVFAGFGGGAKIILPGICHIQTCEDFHRTGVKALENDKSKPAGLGIMENNNLRLNMEQAAEMVGLDMKIDTIMNGYCETAAIYAGSLKGAYSKAVEDARSHYDTPQAKDCDVVIANSFAKVAECESGLEIAFPSVKKEGGDVILIGNCPDGHVAHYLGGPWGKTKRHKLQVQCALPPAVNRLLFYNQYPDLTIFGFFAQPDKVSMMSKWEDVVTELDKTHQGKSIRVAVYPNADVQYCSTATGSRAMAFVADS